MSGDKPEHPIRPDEQHPLHNKKVGEDMMPVGAESEQIDEELIDERIDVSTLFELTAKDLEHFFPQVGPPGGLRPA